jgi:hypothetical protein
MLIRTATDKETELGITDFLHVVQCFRAHVKGRANLSVGSVQPAQHSVAFVVTGE